MHREDDSKYLLFIEPKIEQKSKEPIDDQWTQMLSAECANAILGTSSYNDINDTGSFTPGNKYDGVHTTDCGEVGLNQDLLLSNGMITHSLAVFYIRWYRDAIPAGEWKKLKHLAQAHEAKKMASAYKK
jgi:hypothetical protein